MAEGAEALGWLTSGACSAVGNGCEIDNPPQPARDEAVFSPRFLVTDTNHARSSAAAHTVTGSPDGNTASGACGRSHFPCITSLRYLPRAQPPGPCFQTVNDEPDASR